MPRMTKIVENLYTRGHLSDGVGPGHLEEAGIEHAVSLTARGEPGLEGWDGYLHAPMSDGKVVDEPLLRKVADLVTACVLAGEPTLVMCHAGRNRTGLVVCRSLVDVLGVSGEEALRFFRERRPRGVANAAFEAYLTGIPRPRR